MEILLTVLLLAHAIAHLPGFLVGWRITSLDAMPYRTTIADGRVDVGDAGMRVMGTLWLAASLLFVASGLGAAADVGWWLPVTIAGVALSMPLAVLWLPDTRAGVAVNALVILLIVARL
jgi:hypothetical protein